VEYIAFTRRTRKNYTFYFGLTGCCYTISFIYSIRYVLAFFIIVFLQGFLYIFTPPIHVYIRVFDPQINTSDISNMVSEPQIRVTIHFSSP
jgi:hypothetical protein